MKLKVLKSMRFYMIGKILILLMIIIVFKNCISINKGKSSQQAKGQENKHRDGQTKKVSDKLKELEQEKLLEENQKKFLFDKYYHNAYNEYINGNYNKALKWIAKALELIPNDTSALNLHIRIKSAMGEQTSQIKTTKEMLEERMKVYIESLRSEIRSQIKKTEDFVKSEDFRSADIMIKIIEDKLNLLPYDIGLAKEKKKIKEMKVQIQKRLVDKERVEEIRRKEAARRLAVFEELRRQQDKKKQIKKLTKELYANIKRKDYIEARRVANQILAHDPKNKKVVKILDIIRRLETEFLAQQSAKKKQEYEKSESQTIKEKEIAYSEANIIRYPDRYKWEDILKKSEKFTELKAPLQVETPLMKEINKKLQEFHEVKVDSDYEVCLDADCNEKKKVETYQDIVMYIICKEKLQLDEGQCIMSSDATAALSDAISAPINFEAIIPISEVLKQILNSVGLTYVVNPLGLNILSKLKEQQMISKVYNVSDIINPIRSYTDTQTLDFVTTDNKEGIKLEDANFKAIIPSISVIKKTFTDPAILGTTIFNIPPDQAQDPEKRGFYVEDLDRGQIYLRAPLNYHKKLMEYIDGLRQTIRILISIEARFLAVDDNFLEDIGIDWRGLPRGQDNVNALSIVARDGSIEDVQPSAGKLPQPLSSGYIEGRSGSSSWEIKARTQFPSDTLSGQVKNIGGLGIQILPLSSKQLGLAIRAISKKEKAIQLSAPRVIVFNNAYTYLRRVKEITIIEKYEGATATLTPATTIIKEGILLLVKPVVSYDKKYITLEVVPQIVRLQGAPREVDAQPPDVKITEAPRAPIQLPWIVTQSAFTTVRVPDKGSIVIAGLRNVLKSKMVERVPVLGNIPIIGALFKRKQKVDEKRNTVIILTAEILDMQEQEKKNY